MKFKSLASMIFILAVSSIVSAYTIDDVQIEYWSGLGSNQAIVIIDFDTDQNYAFGFRWNTSGNTSYDALVAIDAAGAFDMESYWDEGIIGYYITNMDYLGATKRGKGASFFTSTDGATWNSSWVGASDNTLVNGAFDGWAYGDWAQDEQNNWYFTGTVTTPAPEPITVAMLALGALFFRKK
jgi:hypothetical protein